MHAIQRTIGLLGGTFDPIHFGHLRTALELQQTLGLSEVKLIPCREPVHKKSALTTASHRLEMIRLAIQHEALLTVDDCEIRRQSPSYMIDTLEELQRRLPNTSLCLIVGVDALLGLPTWHRSNDILKIANIIVAHRPGYEVPTTGAVANLLMQHLTHDQQIIHRSVSGHIILQPVTLLEISATEIREQIHAGESPRFLLPDEVYDYIKQHGIYAESSI